MSGTVTRRAIVEWFGQYSDEIGDYVLGPVETLTGTKFGAFPKASLRRGPVAIFEGRDSAIAWMERQEHTP